MSVIVAILQFKDLFTNKLDRDFFARCITGYKYRADLDGEKCIKNCFISMLNSSVIDVDKLDYLIRDSYMLLSSEKCTTLLT